MADVEAEQQSAQNRALELEAELRLAATAQRQLEELAAEVSQLSDKLRDERKISCVVAFELYST